MAKKSAIQEVFDDLEAKKKELAKLKKQRHDSVLLEFEEYETASTGAAKFADKAAKIEAEHDKKFPKLAEQIEKLSSVIADGTENLSELIVRDVIKGKKVEVQKNGAKLVPRLKAKLERQK